MLEIKNVTKVYNTKNEKPVKALIDISINLQSKGLVFITGKSGSGKSTLLNVIAGLDSFDSGDIIVNRKIINNFTRSKFDAYRNTKVGVIFQEYNLLKDFSVEKNISLALELQGQTADKVQIDAILRQVDLEGYANRMPSELSTGQKQRVAIARALIKSPDIILADEPTGALDLKTSIQIFETLKRLSKEKLVIVITHDQEFAEKYGDRIIELSDGQIIRDSIRNEQKTDQFFSMELRKSKIPLIVSMKMGIHNLKSKPFRLLFTIILSAVAFTLFGLSDTMGNYNKNETTLNSFYKSNINAMSLAKHIVYEDNSGLHAIYPYMTEDDLDSLQNKFTEHNFYPVYNYHKGSLGQSVYYINDDNYYYNRKINGSMEINKEIMEDLNIKLIAGQLPNKTYEDNEIVITKYHYSLFQRYYYNEDGNKVEILEPNDIIGKTIKLNSKIFIITGVIDTNFNSERYRDLINVKDSLGNSELDIAILKNELITLFEYGLHNLIYFREGYYEETIENKDSFEFNDKYNSTNILKLYLEDPQDDTVINHLTIDTHKISKFNNLPKTIIWKDGTQRTELKDNEIVIPINSIPTLQSIGDLTPLEDLKYEMTMTLVKEFVDNHFEEIKDKFLQDHGPSVDKVNYQHYILTSRTNEYHLGKDKSFFEEEAIKILLQDVYPSSFENLMLQISFEDTSFVKTVNVVGFYEDPDYQDKITSTLILSDALFKNFTSVYNNNFGLIVTSLTGDEQKDMKLIDFSNQIPNNLQYQINNEVTSTLQRADTLISNFSTVFLYLGLGFVVLASLLLFNFITVIIVSKQKEIGFLRAIGAKSRDIFQIFLVESLLIACINFIIATLATFIISVYIDHILRNDYKVLIEIINFSMRQVIIILMVSIVVAIVSSFIPVYKISRKNPVDILKN